MAICCRRALLGRATEIRTGVVHHLCRPDLFLQHHAIELRDIIPMVQFTRRAPTRKKLLSVLLMLRRRELSCLTQVHRLPDLIKRAKRFLDRFSIFPVFLSTVLFLSFLAIRRPVVIIQF